MIKWLVLFFSVTALAAPPTVTVLYYIRPPGTVAAADGVSVEGRAGKPALLALQKAGITYQLQRQPPLHQYQMVKNDEAPLCALDWYTNAERRGFALMSAPLYQESPFAVVVHRDSSLQNPVSLQTLQSSYTLARAKGLSLGEALDDVMASGKLKYMDWHGHPAEVLAVVMRKKADYALMPSAEMPIFFEQNPQFRTGLRVLHPIDFPPAPTVHMMCSRKVGRAFMEKFDAALEQVRILE